jgi:RNA polymerase sigma-70 factor (ECF subfamily)
MGPQEFTVVFNEHEARVYGFFAYWLRSRPDAEDLTQQTFERAFRAARSYDSSRASLATWLLAIARNLLVDHFRAGKDDRKVRSLEVVASDSLVAVPDEYSLGLDPGLERALARLSEREQELIALRYGADLSGPEVAALTGLTLANTHQILARALRKLRADLDPGGTGQLPDVSEPAPAALPR